MSAEGGQPEISVIIAAWRAEATIGAAVRSALAQVGAPTLEVIVVDDASPDATADAASEVSSGDPRLVIDTLPQNSGPSAARNRGLHLAKGRYAAVLDADDTMAPERLARLYQLAEDTGADIVADNLLRAPVPYNERQAGPFLKPQAIGEGVEIGLDDYLDPASDERFGGSLGYLKPLFRIAPLKRARATYDETLRNSEDFFFVADRLADGARFFIGPWTDYRYTIHDGSISHRLSPDTAMAVMRAHRAFERRHIDRLSAAARRSLKKREHAWRNAALFESLVQDLKNSAPLTAFARVAGTPASFGYVAHRFISIAGNKLRPNQTRRTRGA